MTTTHNSSSPRQIYVGGTPCPGNPLFLYENWMPGGRGLDVGVKGKKGVGSVGGRECGLGCRVQGVYGVGSRV